MLVLGWETTWEYIVLQFLLPFANIERQSGTEPVVGTQIEFYYEYLVSATGPLHPSWYWIHTYDTRRSSQQWQGLASIHRPIPITKDRRKEG